MVIGTKSEDVLLHTLQLQLEKQINIVVILDSIQKILDMLWKASLLKLYQM